MSKEPPPLEKKVETYEGKKLTNAKNVLGDNLIDRIIDSKPEWRMGYDNTRIRQLREDGFDHISNESR